MSASTIDSLLESNAFAIFHSGYLVANNLELNEFSKICGSCYISPCLQVAPGNLWVGIFSQIEAIQFQVAIINQDLRFTRALLVICDLPCGRVSTRCEAKSFQLPFKIGIYSSL